jgi:hypothetical protein
MIVGGAVCGAEGSACCVDVDEIFVVLLELRPRRHNMYSVEAAPASIAAPQAV